MSSASATQPANRPVRGWFSQHRVLSVFLACVFLFALIAGYFVSTLVSGVEINPVDWRVRAFSFRRDPFTNTRFTGIYYSSVASSGIWTPRTESSSVEPSIASLLKSTAQPQQWDLVRINDGGMSIGPAMVWYELLQTYTQGYDLHWVSWTSDNPKLAAILWPAVQDLTEFGLYDQIPALLEYTRQGLQADAFEQKVEKFTQQALLKFCDSSDDPSRVTAAATAASAYGDAPQLKDYLR